MAAIAARLEDALAAPDPPTAGSVNGGEDSHGGSADSKDGPAVAPPPGAPSPEILKSCAALDQSDTANGMRLRAHFGEDLRVLKEAGSKTPNYVAWTGRCWDADHGNLYAHSVAQKVGDRIVLEADYLAMSAAELRACEEASAAARDLKLLEESEPDWGAAERLAAASLLAAKARGAAAAAHLQKRKTGRRKFGVSSKNAGRIAAMLTCAAPHCAVDPDDFNPDPFVLATLAHTLRFTVAPDDECPDPAAIRLKGHLEISPGHSRADMLTKCVPLVYDPGALCPKWLAFLEECLPESAVREFVQVFCGLGLLGVTVQKLVFHYGSGANGKSVFLETLMRVMGPLATGLPAESIIGEGTRSAGAASPDLARLYGVRCLRVLELPADKPLREDLVKKLTGGEKIPVRTLFKGYFEFAPFFTCHLSGNGYPRIDGTDNGIWRRILVVHWPVEIAAAKQRPFEDMIASFVAEYPGILNWLIAGATRFRESRLLEPAAVIAATAGYRAEMDPISDFIATCVEENAMHRESASTLYQAYVSWSMANAKRVLSMQKFGRVMGKKFKKEEGRIHYYLDCRLHDVPPRPDIDKGERW